MQLTLYTDYSLRVLIYLGLKQGELVTISEIAEHYDISRNHLVKVVHGLAKQGFIQSSRGKGGGVALVRQPAQINIGEVVRYAEGDFHMVECFDSDKRSCPIIPACVLIAVLGEATRSFMAVLDRYTLANVLDGNDVRMRALLSITEHPVDFS